MDPEFSVAVTSNAPLAWLLKEHDILAAAKKQGPLANTNEAVV